MNLTLSIRPSLECWYQNVKLPYKYEQKLKHVVKTLIYPAFIESSNHWLSDALKPGCSHKMWFCKLAWIRAIQESHVYEQQKDEYIYKCVYFLLLFEMHKYRLEFLSSPPLFIFIFFFYLFYFFTVFCFFTLTNDS